MPIPFIWENGVYRGRDIMIKGQGEILKEEISTKIEEAGMIREAGPSIGDIIGENRTGPGVFQET